MRSRALRLEGRRPLGRRPALALDRLQHWLLRISRLAEQHAAPQEPAAGSARSPSTTSIQLRLDLPTVVVVGIALSSSRARGCRPALALLQPWYVPSRRAAWSQRARALTLAPSLPHRPRRTARFPLRPHFDALAVAQGKVKKDEEQLRALVQVRAPSSMLARQAAPPPPVR